MCLITYLFRLATLASIYLFHMKLAWGILVEHFYNVTQAVAYTIKVVISQKQYKIAMFLLERPLIGSDIWFIESLHFYWPGVTDVVNRL